MCIPELLTRATQNQISANSSYLSVHRLHINRNVAIVWSDGEYYIDLAQALVLKAIMPLRENTSRSSGNTKNVAVTTFQLKDDMLP